MTGGTAWGTCFQATLEGTGSPSPEHPPNNIHIYNNTSYKSDIGSGADFTVLKLDNYGTNITLQNNLAYGVGVTSSWNAHIITGTGASGLVQSNNSTTTQMKNTFPSWVNATPAVPTDFGLTAGSYAISAGTSVPVWSDSFRIARPQSGASLGAVEK